VKKVCQNIIILNRRRRNSFDKESSSETNLMTNSL